MNYVRDPEILAEVQLVNSEGENFDQADRIISISATQSDDNKTDAKVLIDVRDFKKGTNLCLTVSLRELTGALAAAALNATRSSS